MKNLKELKGVKVLSKTEQKSIIGGYRRCMDGCFVGWCCDQPGNPYGMCSVRCDV